MIPLPFGHQDDEWLVYADLLEEGGHGARAAAVREQVLTDADAGWNYEYRYLRGVGSVGVGVGSVVGSGVGGVGGAAAAGSGVGGGP